MYTVALTDGYRMSCKGIVSKSPNFVFSFAVNNLDILSYSFLGWSKAECFVGNGKNTSSFLCKDGNICSQSWFNLRSALGAEMTTS